MTTPSQKVTSTLPKVISTGELNLGSFVLKVHVLDNGQRVIDSESMAQLFNPDNNFELTEEKALEIVKLVKGVK